MQYCLHLLHKKLHLLQIADMGLFNDTTILKKHNQMTKELSEKEILEHLKMLSDWIRVKHPGERIGCGWRCSHGS